MFEDDFPFPNVNYVSFLEGTSLSKISDPPTHPLQRYRIHFSGANILRERERELKKLLADLESLKKWGEGSGNKKVMIHWRHDFFISTILIHPSDDSLVFYWRLNKVDLRIVPVNPDSRFQIILEVRCFLGRHLIILTDHHLMAKIGSNFDP